MTRIFTISILVICGFASVNCQVWEGKEASFPYPLWGESIYAINDSVAWTLGVGILPSGFYTLERNTISKTNDGGLSWYNVFSPYDEPAFISSIWALDYNHVWITYVEFPNGPTGPEGVNVILESTDGGFDWVPVNVQVNSFVDFIYMWNTEEGIVVGDPDTLGFEIYQTSDGGDTWTRIMDNIEAEPDEFIYKDNYAVRGNQLWFATNKGRVFHTQTKGSSWLTYDAPASGLDYFKMNVDDQGDIFLILNNFEVTPYTYTLYKRDASLQEWNIAGSDTSYMNDIEPVPNSDVILSIITTGTSISAQFSTQISYDEGQSWNIIDSTTRASYLGFFDQNTGYATHAHLNSDPKETMVFRYVGSPLTGLIKNTPLLNIELSVSPNPSSDVINIQLKSDTRENYWILLNSLSGELIHKSIIPNASGFSHTINVQALPAGAYMLTIANGNGVRTEKIIRLE